MGIRRGGGRLKGLPKHGAEQDRAFEASLEKNMIKTEEA